MGEKPQTKSAFFYALAFALATASSAPFWLTPVTGYLRPKLDFFLCHNVWLDTAQYNACFALLTTSRYPARVQGRLLEGTGEQFMAQWRSFPAGKFCFMSCYALSDGAMQATRLELAGQPGLEETATSFIGTGGIQKNSVTWTWHPEGQCNPACP